MYNHVGLQGRLTAAPELKYTKQGTPVSRFTIASDTGRRTAEGKAITDFIDCIAWRQTAEFVSKYLGKGQLAIVEGRITSRSYTDKDGNKRKAVELVVQNISFCESKKEDRGATQHTQTAAPTTGYAQQATGTADPEPSADFAEITEDEDLPF